MKHTAIIILILLFFQTGPVLADEQPILRANLSADQVSVGSQVTLTLVVLVPTWFPKPLEYPSLEIEGMAVSLPPDSTYSISENREGNNWSGITRDYTLYPLEAKRFKIERMDIRVTYADPKTRKPIITSVLIPEIEISAVKPIGSEKLSPFLSGKSLDLFQTISKSSDIYKPGDAIERQITARLEGMPNFFLPPLLIPEDSPGLAIYPGVPVLDEARDEESQIITGIRKEKITYVFEQGGIFRLPAVTLQWWNTDSKQVETARVPSLVFEVKKSFAQQLGELPLFFILFIGFFILIVVFSMLRNRKKISYSFSRRLTQFYQSEFYTFTGMIFKLIFRNKSIAYQGILAWMKKSGLNSTDSIVLKNRNNIYEFERLIYGPELQKASWGFGIRSRLIPGFFRLRWSCNIKNQQLSKNGLDNLNPF